MAAKEINYGDQLITLIHDCLKVLPNDMDQEKERVKHGFVQIGKYNPLNLLAEGKCGQNNYQG